MKTPDDSSPLPPRPASLAALGAAIRRRRESLDLTLDALAALTGISKPYLSNIETARAPGPASEDKLKKIAHALHLPAAQLLAAADWLRTPPSIRKLLKSSPPRRADGTIDLDQVVGGQKSAVRGPTPNPSHAASAIPLRQVPLINRVAAGTPSEFTDLDYPAGVADDYIPAPDLPTAPITSAFALKIVGDSMAPDYTEGDIIILGPPTDLHGKDTAHDGDDCVVRLADNANFATTFKRIYFLKDAAGAITSLRLVPLNPKHGARVVPLEQVTGIYPLLYRLMPPRKRD